MPFNKAFDAIIESRFDFAGLERAHLEMGKAALTAWGKVIRDAAKQEIKRGGMITGDFSGLDVGRGSQDLAGSIRMELIGFNPLLSQGVPRVEVGTDVDYGAYWEFGHWNIFRRKRSQNRWLTSAFLINQAKAFREALKALKVEEFKQRSKVRPLFTGVRTFLYKSSRLMGDINSVLSLGGFGVYRSSFLRTARILGDVDAVRQGAIRARVGRRIIGVGIGRFGLRRIATGRYRVPRRIMRRIAGRKAGSLMNEHF